MNKEKWIAAGILAIGAIAYVQITKWMNEKTERELQEKHKSAFQFSEEVYKASIDDVEEAKERMQKTAKERAKTIQEMKERVEKMISSNSTHEIKDEEDESKERQKAFEKMNNDISKLLH